MKTTALKLFALISACLGSFAASAAVMVHDAMTGYMHNAGMLLTLNRLPTASDFDARRVTNPGQGEVIRQRFYDSLLYPTAGAAQFTFFSAPVGQGVTSTPGAVVGTPKTLFDTNLELPNTLPSGKQFLIESIELLFEPGASNVANTFTMAAPAFFAAVAAVGLVNSANDVHSFYNSGLLALNVLSKNYLREMTQAFPPKAYLNVDGSAASNSATVGAIGQSWARQAGRAYYLEPEITLQPAVNFEVALTYPAAVATPSGFNGRVICILDGYWLRASQ